MDQFGGEARPDLVVDLVRSGQVTEDRIDESARRAVLAGQPDAPFDDPDPLFRYGHGLTF